jgi:uncharacterized protein YxeA
MARIKREREVAPKTGRRSDKDVDEQVAEMPEISVEEVAKPELEPEPQKEKPWHLSTKGVITLFGILIVLILGVVGINYLKYQKEQTELRKASIYLDQSRKVEQSKEASKSQSIEQSQSISKSQSVEQSLEVSRSKSERESQSIEQSKSISQSLALAPAEYTITDFTSNGHVQLVQFSGNKYQNLNSKLKAVAEDQARLDRDAAQTGGGNTATAEVVNNQNNHITVLYSTLWNAGGPSSVGGITINVINGNPVTVREMFKNNSAYVNANTKLWNLMAENSYIEVNQTDDAAQLENAGAVYWKDDGLVVIFDKYMVAAGVYGPQEFFIPNISDLLK